MDAVSRVIASCTGEERAPFHLSRLIRRRSRLLLAQTRFRIAMLFRKHKFLTGVAETRKQLDIGHKVRSESTCLSIFVSTLIRFF
jgi:hypothetical protein